MTKKFSKNIKYQKQRMAQVIDVLASVYPNVKIQLEHTNPFELLIATILSAQCTDNRVNIVTKTLFEKYKIPQDYLIVDPEELERDIFSTGFYKTKARNIRLACKMIIDEFDGEVPNHLDDLVKLPGVGRKTANVILGHCFDTPAIVVDTHVIRISNKLGFVATTDAVKIEHALMKLIPRDIWATFTHYFINHGRNTCIARRPRCTECKIAKLCPSAHQ